MKAKRQSTTQYHRKSPARRVLARGTGRPLFWAAGLAARASLARKPGAR